MEADFSVTEMAMGGNSRNARYKGDENLYVKFVNHPREDKSASKEAGRPIFKEVPYIQIMVPGNKESVIFQPATQMDKDRFPEHYRRFEARMEQGVVEGTPLAEWPGVTRSQVEELKYFNIHTVEQLAAAPDSSVSGIMGVNILKSKAKAYLEAAEQQAAANELKDARDRIEHLEGLIAQMNERLDAEEEKPAAKRRGRPPKTE